MIDLFGYDLGFFSGKGPNLPEDTQSPYLVAGKLYARYKGLNLLDIKAGYNAYYHYYNHIVPQHNLAQGFFVKTVLSFGTNLHLSLLSEYQERLKLRNVINQNMDWARGIFAVVSCRYAFVESLVILEWYDGSLLRTDDEDMFSLSTGLAGYFLKKDLLLIKLLYDLEYPYDSGILSHTVSAMLQMEF